MLIYYKIDDTNNLNSSHIKHLYPQILYPFFEFEKITNLFIFVPHILRVVLNFIQHILLSGFISSYNSNTFLFHLVVLSLSGFYQVLSCFIFRSII